jgi:hypothetical protein
MSIVRVLLTGSLLLVVATVAACHNDNPYYCEDRAYHNCVNASGTFPCNEKADCAGQSGKRSCTELNEATGFGTCVQCTASDTAACLGETPVCGAEHVCRGCSKHVDCASSACLPDGSCGSDANVAYVAAAGSGATCTKADPCGTLAAAVAKGKAYIKVGAGNAVKDTQVTVIDGKAVTILADEGAKVDRSNEGAVLEVRSENADVKIYDLEITGATGASGANGIDVNPNGGSPKLALTRVTISGNQGIGLSASGGSVAVSQSTISGNQGMGLSASGGSVAVSQSTIRGNQGMGLSASGGSVAVSQSTIRGNTGGGISVSNATFDITNNFIYRNGNSAASTYGGLSLIPIGDSKLEFNTIVDNEANVGYASAGGVFCDLQSFVAVNNLVFRNTGGPMANLQTFGACTYGNSFVRAGSSAVDNLPEFARPNGEPFDYHLTTASPTTVRDAGGACVGVDIDGDARPQGGACDLGADEHKAN